MPPKSYKSSVPTEPIVLGPKVYELQPQDFFFILCYEIGNQISLNENPPSKTFWHPTPLLALANLILENGHL